MSTRGPLRKLITAALFASPIALGFVVTRAAPAAPPGPWTFIPPASASKIVVKLPGASSTPSAPAPSASGTSSKPEDGMERARRSTVVIERNKKPVALGILLADRPVVLTALSPIILGGAGDLEVRFSDSTVTTKAKLVHEDEKWDLALLVPASSKWAEGAKSSEADPLSPTATFSTFVLLKTGKVQVQATAVLGRRDYLSPDGDVLKDALAVDTKNVAIGTALVDAAGGVVAMVGRACAPGSNKVLPSGGKSPCVPSLFGAPLSVVKRFLKSAPVIKPPTPWLGIVALTDKIGARVLVVQPGSPAAAAGIKPWDPGIGDTIIGVDNQIVHTSEELAEAVRKHSPGDELKLYLVSGESIRDAKVVLKSTEDGPDAPATTKPPPPPVSPSTITPLPPLPPLFSPPKAKGDK